MKINHGIESWKQPTDFNSKTFAELEKANGAFRVDVRDFAEAPVAERASPAAVVVVVVTPSVTDARVCSVYWRYG